jgi:hypothetical protein
VAAQQRSRGCGTNSSPSCALDFGERTDPIAAAYNDSRSLRQSVLTIFRGISPDGTGRSSAIRIAIDRMARRYARADAHRFGRNLVRMAS